MQHVHYLHIFPDLCLCQPGSSSTNHQISAVSISKLRGELSSDSILTIAPSNINLEPSVDATSKQEHCSRYPFAQYENVVSSRPCQKFCSTFRKCDSSSSFVLSEPNVHQSTTSNDAGDIFVRGLVWQVPKDESVVGSRSFPLRLLSPCLAVVFRYVFIG